MSLFGLIPEAHAQATGSQGAADGLAGLLQTPLPMFILLGLIFYFFLMRPQQQKQKQLRAQLSEMKRGDTVVTSGGIIGTVARVVSDDEVALDIAEGVRVRVVRATITSITAKGEPRGDDKDAAEDAKAPTLLPTRRGRPTPANQSKP
jgi:preprotein translocase subunit YajC